MTISTLFSNYGESVQPRNYSVNTTYWSKFLHMFEDVEYDKGYGSQELSATIVFNDGTWLDRWEYDGSEGYEYNETPTRPTKEEGVMYGN